MVAAIVSVRPDLTPAFVAEQWQIALERERAGKTENARDLLFGVLKSGGVLYGRATAAVDWSAYAEPEREPEVESLHAHARRILPDGASGHDWQFVLARLASGDTDEAALAALRQARAR